MNLLLLDLTISTLITLVWISLGFAFGLRGGGMVTLTVAVFVGVMFVLAFFQAAKHANDR